MTHSEANYMEGNNDGEDFDFHFFFPSPGLIHPEGRILSPMPKPLEMKRGLLSLTCSPSVFALYID